MTLTSFNIIELSTFVVSILGATALVIKQTQSSKCKSCKICFGLLSCERDIENQDQVPEQEINNNVNIEN